MWETNYEAMEGVYKEGLHTHVYSNVKERSLSHLDRHLAHHFPNRTINIIE